MPNEKCGGLSFPPTTTPPTPYGKWICVNGQAEWVPEFGRLANNMWNRLLIKMAIKK